MEQKPSKKKHCKYEADFKKEVLKMIESGRSVTVDFIRLEKINV